MTDSYDQFPQPMSAPADTSLPDPTIGSVESIPDERAVDEPDVDEQDDGAGFAALGLRPELLKALADLGYEEPTPIQRETIPHADRRPRPARSGRHRHRQDRGVRPPGAAAHRHQPARRAVGARARADPRARGAGERGDVQVRQGARDQGRSGVRRAADPAPAAAARPWRARRRRHAGPRDRPHRTRVAQARRASAR